MAGMRDYADAELDLVRKSFSGRYALRDRCYFEMALQMGLRVSEMLSLTVGQVYQYGKIVDEVSIERKHMKGGEAGKASGRTLPVFDPTNPHILAWLQRMASMLKVAERSSTPTRRFRSGAASRLTPVCVSSQTRAMSSLSGLRTLPMRSNRQRKRSKRFGILAKDVDSKGP